MAEVQDFVYDSLPQSSEATSHAIRLLRIHAGDTNTQLKCSLETYNYNTCPDYWALSYTWGPETPSHVIFVNDRRFRIRQNLFIFMQAFRSPYNEDFYLWVDQLCINQEDIPERNSQVRCMGQYYSRAVCVLTWLGIGTEAELAAMARMQQMDVDNVPPAKCEEPISLDLLRGYRSIIANPYFERLWIVQEMARAKDILIMMGTEVYNAETTSWRHFNFAFVQLMLEITIVSTTARAAQQELMLRQEIRDHKILFQLLEVKKHQNAIDIFDLIEAFSDFKCADPRDKLYALQDIGHLQQQLFTIDYAKDQFQVYSDFLVSCVKSGQAISNRHFDILTRLMQVMGIQVEFPTDDESASVPHGMQEANAAAGFETTLQARGEVVQMLKESMAHIANEDVRIFGPQYDQATGQRVSPFTETRFRARIPTVFKIPAAVDREEMSKVALQGLSKLLGRDLGALLQAERGDAGEQDSVADGYRTVTMLSGDVRHWGLPPMDEG